MKDQYTIAVLPGDGIGPEVVGQAIKVLQAIADKSGFKLTLNTAPVGGAAIDQFDNPLPESTLDTCKQADAVLLGAIGAPQYDNLPSDKRPERGLLGLRAGLGLYANLRPARVFPGLVNASSLKPELVSGIDILIVRELTGGIYFGNPRGFDDKDGGRGFNTMVYTTHEVDRIAKIAFDAAMKRGKKVMSVDKANVLEVSQFWRQQVIKTAAAYPEIELEHMYVDNCAMQLVRNPKQFDVIVTGNLFGDILSDEAAMLTGSLGMLPSASMGDGTALYEPVHGSAPDIAGKNIANPLATIASVAMMLRHSMDRSKEADVLDMAIEQVLQDGHRTRDIARQDEPTVSTTEMGDLVVNNVKKQL